jgi:predicted  nucleic acid-binding Zn-ribbon protein
MPPRVVIVLGMHRSGTSLLAQILHRAGICMGGNLMPADAHNLEGYFEDLDIVAIHDRILASLRREWGSVRSTLPLPDDWLAQPETIKARDELTEIVRQRLAQHGTGWGFKDPRTCRLLPLWLGILAECGISPMLLMCNRAPAEVALSLERRDAMPRRIGELLWLEHVIEPLIAGGDRIAAVLDWDRWFIEAEAQVAALAGALALPTADIAAAMAEAVKPSLRHQRSPVAASIPLANDLHIALRSWSQHGICPSAIPSLIDRFHDAAATMEGWADVALASDWMADLHQRDARIAELTAQRDKAQESFTEYRTAYDRDISAYRSAYDDTMQAYRTLEGRFADCVAEVDRRDTSLAALQAECDRAKASVAEYRAAYDHDVGVYRDAHDNVLAAYRTLEAQLLARTAEVTALTAEVTAHTAEVTSRTAEVHRLESEIARLRVEHAAMQAGVAECHALVADLMNAAAIRRRGMPRPISLLDAVRQTREIVFSSRWALTWPLRWARHRLRIARRGH